MYREHWRQIRTRFSRNNRVQDWYNFRIDTLNTDELNQLPGRGRCGCNIVFRLNLSFGFALCNNETGELQYYHASHNNITLFDEPFLNSNAQDLEKSVRSPEKHGFLRIHQAETTQLQMDC
jgi:hypothetical protein